MESPRNTTLDSPLAGGPSLASSSRYLAKSGQSRNLNSVAELSSLSDAQGSDDCCADAVTDRIKLARRTKIGFIKERTTSAPSALGSSSSSRLAQVPPALGHRVERRPDCSPGVVIGLEADLGSKLHGPGAGGGTNQAKIAGGETPARNPQRRRSEQG